MPAITSPALRYGCGRYGGASGRPSSPIVGRSIGDGNWLLGRFLPVCKPFGCGCGPVGTIPVCLTLGIYQGSRTLHILTMGGGQSQLTAVASVARIEDKRRGHPIFERHPDVMSTDVGGCDIRWANASPNNVETSQSKREAVAGRTAQAGRVTAYALVLSPGLPLYPQWRTVRNSVSEPGSGNSAPRSVSAQKPSVRPFRSQLYAKLRWASNRQACGSQQSCDMGTRANGSP